MGLVSILILAIIWIAVAGLGYMSIRIITLSTDVFDFPSNNCKKDCLFETLLDSTQVGLLVILLTICVIAVIYLIILMLYGMITGVSEYYTELKSEYIRVIDSNASGYSSGNSQFTRIA
jgi:hypothetical protein